jgi:hypothetical protein
VASETQAFLPAGRPFAAGFENCADNDHLTLDDRLYQSAFPALNILRV